MLAESNTGKMRISNSNYGISASTRKVAATSASHAAIIKPARRINEMSKTSFSFTENKVKNMRMNDYYASS